MNMNMKQKKPNGIESLGMARLSNQLPTRQISVPPTQSMPTQQGMRQQLSAVAPTSPQLAQQMASPIPLQQTQLMGPQPQGMPSQGMAPQMNAQMAQQLAQPMARPMLPQGTMPQMNAQMAQQPPQGAMGMNGNGGMPQLTPEQIQQVMMLAKRNGYAR